MTPFARIIIALLAALTAFPSILLADPGVCCIPNATRCQLPVAKTYRIQPSFCPQELVVMIPQCVPGGCSSECGPYGVPPIFASGNQLVIRQTPEVHERIVQYLTSLGAYLKPVKVVNPR